MICDDRPPLFTSGQIITEDSVEDVHLEGDT